MDHTIILMQEFEARIILVDNGNFVYNFMVRC
jgi:hypothetical protein